MLESWSDEARRAVPLAMAEARRLGHPRVGTEHLLLGLLVGDDESAGDALRAAGATLAAARHKVAEVLRGEPALPLGETLPYTARAQRALDRAGRFSRQDRAPDVTTRHVLLGVLDVEGLACQVLRGLGVDVVQLRNSVAAETGVARGPVDERPTRAAMRPSCRRCGGVLDDTLAESAMVIRGDDEVTTIVSVVFCGACGETLGVLRPSS